MLQKYLHENSFHSLDEYFELPKLNFEIWSELTHEDLGTNVPSLYLQVYNINMSVYIQPLSVTKENFLLKSTANCV